jgi:Nuclease-related domain
LLFAKECMLPPRIGKLEVIVRRLRESHLSKYDIVMEYNNRLTGHRGEESVDFYLESLSSSDYRIYHDLRFLLGKYYFQIDVLILCSRFIVVLQIKNWSRDWHFEKNFKQTSINNKGKMERTPNPIQQAKVQAMKLKKWLENHNITGIPILYIFVNSNENVHINSDDYQMTRNMCNSEMLLEKIEQIANDHKLVKLDDKELKKINRLFLTKHTPDDPDLIKLYNLSVKEDILTGVQCPNPKCNYLPIPYKSGTWCCPRCRTKSKTAFIKGIQDYFLLISPSIKNSEARNFLQIQSRKVMHRLLTSMNLPVTGSFKNRTYHQPPKQ